MKYFYSSFLLFFLVQSSSFSQVKYDYNWLFGIGPLSIMGEGTLINFNDKPINISTYDTLGAAISQTNVTISDKDGNLLFYSNGCFISDATNNVMMNGDSLNPGRLHNDFYCNTSGYRIVQGMIGIPSVENENVFLLFHVKDTLITNPVIDVYGDILYCTTIDMTLNNGLGAVIKKNEVIIQDSLNTGEIMAVKHANGLNWWILMPKHKSNGYFTLLLTETGIDAIFEQSIGIPIDPGGGGQAVFSPNGNIYARYNTFDDLVVYDFDRNTGLLSNFRQANIPVGTSVTGGIAISPNSRFIYCHNKFEIYQFDLEADDLQASSVKVATYDGFTSPFPTNFYLAQLGPDCRIYINSTNGVDVLHVINHPDEKGVACEVAQHSIQLASNHVFSIPNYPNYRLGLGPPCDTSIVVSNQNIFIPPAAIKVYPNPANEVIHLEWENSFTGPFSLRLKNALGEIVKEKKVAVNTGTEELWVEEIPSGVYFLEVMMSNQRKHVEKIMIVR